MMANWWQEFRYAGRGLWRAPGWTAAAVLTLALGIGVTAALSSAVYAGAWRPLPFPAPKQLVEVYGGARRSAPSPGDIADLRARSHTLANIAVYRLKQVTLSRPAPVRRVRALLATPALLATLGVAPQLGRGFAAEELQPGGARVALLSDRFWRQEFQARRDVVGERLMLDGQAATIIGVLPPAMEPLMEGNAIMTPLALAPAEWADRESRMYTAVARLRPQATLAAARADVAAAGREMARLHSEDRKLAFELTPLHQDMVGQLGATPGLLIATAGLILGLVCANVGGLLVARAVGRRRETAVRLALGASRGQVARQAAAEAALLGAAGGALGGWLAWAMFAGMGWLHPPQWLRTATAGMAATAGLCAAASVAAAVLCSLAPMAVAARTEAAGLQAGATATRAGRTRGRLVAAQLALALMLAMAAGVLIRSVAKLTAMPVGFDPQQVLTAGFGLPGGMTPEAEANFYQRMLEQTQALAGVRAAALTDALPFDASRGILADHDGARAVLRWSAVSPTYFATLGIPLLRGRGFAASDRAGMAQVAVVSEKLAAEWWPGADPLGRQFTLRFKPDTRPWTVVGVVGDTRQMDYDEPLTGAAYLPVAQFPKPGGEMLVARAAGNPLALVHPLQERAAALDPLAAVVNPETLSGLMADTIVRRTFMLKLLAMAAGLALLLAAVGVYGAMGAWVEERRREVGVRMALGADRKAVVRLVLGRAARWAVAGVALGAGGGWMAARALRSLLFGVGPTDAATLAACAALLVVITCTAAWAPARRAAATDPATTLRGD